MISRLVAICLILLIPIMAVCVSCEHQVVRTSSTPKTSSDPSSKANDKQRLRLVTYNVLADNENASERIPKLLGILKTEGSDVIALQEVTFWFLSKLKNTDWIKNYHLSLDNQSNGCPGGLLIMSKFPIVNFKYIPFAVSKQRRGLLAVTVKIHNNMFRITTVHLDSFLERGQTRAKQLDQLWDFLKNSENSIVMGDFNFGDSEEPDSSHIDKNYKDIWLILHPDEQGFTWDIKQSLMAKIRSFKNEKSRRLDRIFIKSPTLKPLLIKIIGNKPLRRDLSLFPSDHFGLSAIVIP